MAKVDTVPNYNEIVDESIAQQEARQKQLMDFAQAVTPDQAAAYEGTQYTQPEPEIGPPSEHQIFANAVENFRQPRAPLAPTGSISQDAIGAEMQANLEQNSPQLITPGSNLLMAQEAPEAFNVMQGAMAGTGLQANMPGPLRPADAPQELEHVQPEQDAGMQIAQEQAQREVAAKQVQQRQLAQEQQQMQVQHEQNIQQAADNKIAEQDQKAEGQDWGSIVGQGVAVGMGEYARYLIGGKENLVIKTMERLSEEKARKEKLTLEEKLAGQKHALDLAALELRKEELKTDSQLKRAQIAKIGAEIGDARLKVEMQQRVSALIRSGKGFSAEDLQMLPEGDRERSVLLPNGSYGLATVNKERLNEGQKTITSNTQGAKQLKELISLSDYFGNNPGKKVASREQIARAQTLAQSLKGQLRLSLLGPGAITDYEHEMLNKIIRDPTAIMSFDSANKAALNTILNKLNTERDYTYRSLGVNLPPTVNEKNIEAYKKAYPGMSEAQAIERLTKMGKWEN